MSRKLNFIFLFFLGLCSCMKTEKDVVGIYVKEPSFYTVDSLFLYADSTKNTGKGLTYIYEQRFYNKLSGVLLFRNLQDWRIGSDGRIELSNLYVDWDNRTDSKSFSPEAITNSVIFSSLPFEGSNIVVDYDRKIFYKKVK